MDDVSDKLGKKLFSAGALAALAIRGIHSAAAFVSPALDGLRSATDRLYTALQQSVVHSGVFQTSTAGIRVALEGLAEFIESKAAPQMLSLANKVRAIADGYSDAATAAGNLLRIQREFAKDEAKKAKGVEKEIKNVDVDLGQKKEVLAAQRENAKARINLNEKDPLARAAKLAEVDRQFDARGKKIENEADTKKGGILNKEVGRIDEEILAAGAQLPQMGTLPKLAQQAQDAAVAERAALAENRKNFVIRERIRQMGGSKASGRTAFAEMAIKDREELSSEDQLVYDFVSKSGGMEKAVPAIESELTTSRARLGQAKAARVDAFGRLPRGVGTPAEAATYEKDLDLQVRRRIDGLQEQQESIGERSEDIGTGQQQRNAVTPITDSTRELNATREFNQTKEHEKGRVQGELDQAYRELGDSFGRYHGENIEKVRELKRKIDDITNQLRSIESRRW